MQGISETVHNKDARFCQQRYLWFCINLESFVFTDIVIGMQCWSQWNTRSYIGLSTWFAHQAEVVSPATKDNMPDSEDLREDTHQSQSDQTNISECVSCSRCVLFVTSLKGGPGRHITLYKRLSQLQGILDPSPSQHVRQRC